MKRFLKFVFFCSALFLCFITNAYANISPLNIKTDGVEPVQVPDVKIEYADITVTPSNGTFLFNCKYGLKSKADIENLNLGIPGDMGYTLEAGYIENMNITVNGKPAKYKTYNTTEHMTVPIENASTSMHFKWHVFPVSMKKDAAVNINVSYSITWRIFEQDKTNTYYIIPFILSTDKFFQNDIGNYKITYISDDEISLPDTKVLLNSMMEPNIISPVILSPDCDGNKITWVFKNVKDFQDFRLVALPFKKTAMEFSTGTDVDDAIKWAALNNNYSRLANLFEDIARDNVSANLSNEQLGNAAYLAAEYYFRIKNYDKALEMLSLPDKPSIWPSAIKYEYIDAMRAKQKGDYDTLLQELEKLGSYKDYILVSNFAEKEIKPVMDIQMKQALEEAPSITIKQEVKNEKKPDFISEYRYHIAAVFLFIVSAAIAVKYLIAYRRKRS